MKPQPVFLQLQLGVNLWSQQAEKVGRAGELKPWDDLLGDSSTPDDVASLKDGCVHPQFLQVGGLEGHTGPSLYAGGLTCGLRVISTGPACHPSTQAVSPLGMPFSLLPL